MNSTNNFTSIALVGGGPAALFMFKRLVDSGLNYEVDIFERNSKLGAGMPYSFEGANKEHVTNVSDTEIPDLVNSIEEWLPKAPDHLLHEYKINQENFNELKVVPRLFFGEYLSAQFERLIKAAKHTGLKTAVHFNTEVKDLADDPGSEKVRVIAGDKTLFFDQVVICTGHMWPKKNEGKVKGYFDSPYPPSKLVNVINYPVALRGSSLTAFDAIRTLSRSNGCFSKNEAGKLNFKLNKESEGFKIVMHSLDGLLPAIRIHLEDSHLGKDLAMTENELKEIRELNDGFVPLDYLFEEKFKASFREKDPEFYARIRNKNLEEFVDDMMSFRESLDPFTLFKAEYAEAEKSIRRQEPVPWKEMLAVLSYIINYPAKYFPAEDMLRLKKVLMPLISIVIAFVPQSSAEELLALYDAGVLSMVAVGADSKVEPGTKEGVTYSYTDERGEQHKVSYRMFIDCIGQPPLSIEDIPFKGLVESNTVTPATLQFRSISEATRQINEGNKDIELDSTGKYYLQVPGIMINDYFQVVDNVGAVNNRIFVMAVPYIGGVNPDYSGLDFCEAASTRIIKRLALLNTHVS